MYNTGLTTYKPTLFRNNTIGYTTLSDFLDRVTSNVSRVTSNDYKFKDDTLDVMVPGYSKEDLELKYSPLDHSLNVKGLKEDSNLDLTFDLNGYNYSADISAKCLNGILSIKFKPEKDKTKQIKIT